MREWRPPAEIKLRAERKVGGMLRGTERDSGGRPAKTSTQREPVSSPPTLADLGLSKKASR